MDRLTIDHLTTACTPGGASVLTAITELVPAAGEHAGIAPARYVNRSTPTYAFGTRYVDHGDGPTASDVVTVDSKASAANRVEEHLSQAIKDGEEPLAQTPRIEVTYPGMEPILDLDLPHRAADGHIRAGQIDGAPATKNAVYRAARDSSPANARALLETSPITLILGGWDATRRSHQFRFRSALVGETIGVLADQSGNGRDVSPRGGARFDTVAPSVRLGASELKELLAAQADELSPGNVGRIEAEIKKAGKGTTSAAALGLGAIPPSLETLGLVSCSRIIRSHVLSFASLRQIRFGLGRDGDAAARALLAALAINGLVRSYEEITYRADCDLVEKDSPVARLDARGGRAIDIALPDVSEADALLASAIDRARAAGVRWEGQVLSVTGNQLVAGGMVAEADDDAKD